MDRNIITKHCRPQDRERMLNGHFKFGTLAEYTPRSGRAGGLYSDEGEGTGQTLLSSTLNNASGQFFGFRYNDLTTENTVASFAYTLEIDYPVFCASVFEYDPQRHRRLLEGTSDYAGNPDCTAFLTIDGHRFCDAIVAMCNHLYGENQFRCFATYVRYGERKHFITPERLSLDRHKEEEIAAFHRAAFIKPLQFVVEEEFRFVIVSRRQRARAEQIFTSSLPTQIVSLFERSIEDRGSDTPM